MNEKRIIVILSVILALVLILNAYMLGRESMGYNNSVNVSNINTSGDNKTIDDITDLNNGVENTDELSRDNNISDNNDNNGDSKTVKEVSSTKYSNNDRIVIGEVSKLETETDEILNANDKKTAGEKAKGVFIFLVDFIFYGGEIKGVTFDELSDSGKEKVLKIANSIDTKIENKYPGYKDDISTKAKGAFTKASEIIKNGTSKFSEFSREKLGDENYNSIIDAKDDLVNYTKTVINIVKENGTPLITKSKNVLKTWYENFKNNN